jgi:small GTP-binding protein
MPTNLPPEYYDADERYRAASTVQEKIETLEDLIGTIPKHKGTDKLRAGLRRRLSKLKSSTQGKQQLGRKESVYNIDKEGAGQVVIIGYANVGKSSFVASLTNATPEVAEFPFTTWKPTPGMMQVEDIQIQVIDTPPLNRDFVEPELLDMIRRADVVILMVDLQADPLVQLEESMAFLKDHRIAPLHDEDLPREVRQTLKPIYVVVNKNDDESTDEDFDIFRELLEEDCPLISISVKTGRNIDELKRLLFDELEVIRIYSKAPGKDPDLSTPYIMEKGSTVEEFARKVHQDFYKNLKTARVWGDVAFEGQMVSRNHVLKDGDVVELKK